MKELFGWPKHDANWILIIEFALMMAFFKMNASDFIFSKEDFLNTEAFRSVLTFCSCIQ
jgi:hypothetical protein